MRCAAVLMLSERRPDPDALGGTEVHVADLLSNAPRRFRLYSAHASGRRLVIEAWHAGGRAEIAALHVALPRDALERPALADALTAALLGTGADILHVHSPALGPRDIAAAVEASGARCIVTLHDHALACENPLLLERNERFCGLPEDASRCDECLAHTHSQRPGRLRAWRSATRELVLRADAVVAPSASVAKLVGIVHPELRAKVRRIPWGVPRAAWVPMTRAARPLKVAVVGVLADVKGAGVLPALLSATSDLDVEWHVFGAREGRSIAALERAAPRVVVHGAYRRAELARQLAAAGCQLGLLPSIAPESFGMVLSELAAAACPALVSRLGALEERVDELGAGWTFDPFRPSELRARLAGLLAHPHELEAAAGVLRKLPAWTPADMARSHAALWRDIAALGPRHAVSEEARRAARSRLQRERRRPSLIVPAVRALRRSSFYRDLGVRGWVPENIRSRLERSVSAWIDQWRDREESR